MPWQHPLSSPSRPFSPQGAAKEGGRGPSTWDTFSATAGKVFGGQTGEVATDFYHKYLEVSWVSWFFFCAILQENAVMQ